MFPQVIQRGCGDDAAQVAFRQQVVAACFVRPYAVVQHVAERVEAGVFQRCVERAPYQRLPELGQQLARSAAVAQPFGNGDVGAFAHVVPLQRGHVAQQLDFVGEQDVVGPEYACGDVPRRRQGGRLKLQTFMNVPLQRAAHEGLFRPDADALHQGQYATVRAYHDVLAVVEETEAVVAVFERAGAPSGLFSCFEQGYVGAADKLNGGGKPRPACADDGDFRSLGIIHGLNPNNQVFKAMRFLRGEGMAIL